MSSLPDGLQLAAASDAVMRHVCRVDGRWLHYRRLGAGPPVLLLHQTPQSSQTLEPLMRVLAPHCTALAVDTPGFGQSEPLPGDDWSIAQLADVMAAFLDALGIPQVAVCGQHTGAAIGAELALRHPHRVSSLALDGLPLFSADEVQRVLPHQLYRFQPQPDGTHLMWAWSRFRDGWLFFPWSQRDRAHRRDLDLPGPDLIHRTQVMELLRSRESHLRVYPGVFAWPAPGALDALRLPLWTGTTADDQLFPHLRRLPALPPGSCVEPLPRGARAQVLQAQARWTLARLPKGVMAPATPHPLVHWRGDGGRGRAVVDGLSVHGVGLDRPGPVSVLLHRSGGSARCELLRLQDSADGDAVLPDLLSRPVVAIDLPGHGDSGGELASLPEAARRVASVLAVLGLHEAEVYGRGLGAAVAVEWALHSAQTKPVPGGAICCPRSLHLSELAVLDEAGRVHWRRHYATPFEPVWDGTHLVRLWHELRDRELFHPWFERGRTHIRPIEPRLDGESLTQAVFAALCCSDWVGAHALWLDWRPDGPRGVAAARATGVPVHLHAHPGDGWARALETL
jgi:pimeloyl-ACP methyl ester carboxylesterase